MCLKCAFICSEFYLLKNFGKDINGWSMLTLTKRYITQS